MNRIGNGVRVLLAFSLLIGAGVNAWAAKGFMFTPLKEAQNLGLPIVGSGDSGDTVPSNVVHNVEVLLQLTGVLLLVLGAFYLMVAVKVYRSLQLAENAENYAEGVAFSVFARLCGVAFYIWILTRDGRPSEFKTYLIINFALAISHALFLGRAGWSNLLKIRNSQATTGEH